MTVVVNWRSAAAPYTCRPEWQATTSQSPSSVAHGRQAGKRLFGKGTPVQIGVSWLG